MTVDSAVAATAVAPSGDVARYEAAGFPGTPIGLGGSPAVVVVDMQRLFLSPPTGPATGDAHAERVASLLDGARAAAVPVVYLKVVFDHPDEVGEVWAIKAPALRLLVRGAPETEFHPALSPQPGDLVIEKKRASGFFGTDLDDRLRRMGVDTLLVVGTSTSGCVRATAVDGFQADYRVIVVADGVEDRAVDSHTAALTDHAAKYGDVATIAELLTTFAAATAATPA